MAKIRDSLSGSLSWTRRVWLSGRSDRDTGEQGCFKVTGPKPSVCASGGSHRDPLPSVGCWVLEHGQQLGGMLRGHRKGKQERGTLGGLPCSLTGRVIKSSAEVCAEPLMGSAVWVSPQVGVVLGPRQPAACPGTLPGPQVLTRHARPRRRQQIATDQPPEPVHEFSGTWPVVRHRPCLT